MSPVLSDFLRTATGVAGGEVMVGVDIDYHMTVLRLQKTIFYDEYAQNKR
jgi:hypothetical protein